MYLASYQTINENHQNIGTVLSPTVSSKQAVEIDWENSKGTDSVCFCCRRPGHVVAKCIADMPQEVKDHIVSGAALVVREDELDELADDDVTETVAFARDNPRTFALMANALRPARDDKDEWEPKFKYCCEEQMTYHLTGPFGLFSIAQSQTETKLCFHFSFILLFFFFLTVSLIHHLTSESYITINRIPSSLRSFNRRSTQPHL